MISNWVKSLDYDDLIEILHYVSQTGGQPAHLLEDLLLDEVIRRSGIEYENHNNPLQTIQQT